MVTMVNKLCVIVSMFLNTTAIIKIQIFEKMETLGRTKEQIFTHFTDELLGCVTSHLMIFTPITASGLLILKFSQLKICLKRSSAQFLTEKEEQQFFFF